MKDFFLYILLLPLGSLVLSLVLLPAKIGENMHRRQGARMFVLCVRRVPFLGAEPGYCRGMINGATRFDLKLCRSKPTPCKLHDFLVVLLCFRPSLPSTFCEPMQVGNWIFWVLFCVVGQPMSLLLYYRDYCSEHSCSNPLLNEG